VERERKPADVPPATIAAMGATHARARPGGATAHRHLARGGVRLPRACLGGMRRPGEARSLPPPGHRPLASSTPHPHPMSSAYAKAKLKASREALAAKQWDAALAAACVIAELALLGHLLIWRAGC